MNSIAPSLFKRMAEAARDGQRVAGHTHNFYRYPARFSPKFAATAIKCFSAPSDLVLDPYMGGGTTVIEAMLAGRRCIGSDINELAAFVARAKVTGLSVDEVRAVRRWAVVVVPTLKCNLPASPPERTARNMTLPRARWLRKAISLMLTSIECDLESAAARRFARCVVLNVGQWALNGRKRATSVGEFRKRVIATTDEMLKGMETLRDSLARMESPIHVPILIEDDAEHIDRNPVITAAGPVDLVVTSPPYPGIHMLYHRWQVDGRKETDAPYWIAACNDGCGTAYYNFADRRRTAEDQYFDRAERSFSAVRRIMRRGAIIVQIVAFSDPERQLSRYLSIMQRAGFEEVRANRQRRIRRTVPSRQWHAMMRGETASSREVVLVHQSV